ncbi:MAG: Protein ApaG [Legionellaceae bacterium]
MTEKKSYYIDIKVQTTYAKEQSDPSNQYYVFIYQIRIHNLGTVGVKLISRHWTITDAQGTVQEIRGIGGVIGEQPYLKPGEIFEYASGAVLNTPVGSMAGDYELLADDGNTFTAEIPAFSLAIPNIIH